MKKIKSQKTKSQKKSAATVEKPDDFLIVGIGASAGGIQALKTFFENVAADSNAAYVVILHLSPDHDSQLAEVLQTVSLIPVKQVKEKVRVEPNHVYVVPPDKSLAMRDGEIIVSPIHTVEERRAPVDIFFRTLAESHCSRAVAVVLSGTGANGSMGIKRVKENGGAAFVQNPREAEFGEMPRNSIATELIDEILNVSEIPAKIVAYGKNLGTVLIPVESEAREEEQQSALREIFTNLRVRTGHDFANYKRPTILRRIERRINVRTLPDLPAYAAYLKETPEETNALLKDLLISVTNFYRDKEAFALLEREVVPRILHGKTSKEQLRVWVAGCATGEEAYSLAMLLAEQIDHAVDAPAIQIFATDIDEDAIAAARSGFYTLNDAADVSPDRLRRFFTQEKDGYRIRRELREMILFANHNLLKDPPFSRLDLVTCRNLLIYFNRTAQERAMETFHFALKPGGYLFLGSSESVDGAGDLYAPVSREQRIFQARATPPRFSYPVPDLSPSMRFDVLPPAAAAVQETQTRALERISYGDLHGRILEQFAPPSIIINELFDIVHVSPHAGRYLEISGEPSQNLFRMIRPDLRLAVSTAVYQAVQNRTNVRADHLKFNFEDRIESVNVSVRPVLRENDKDTSGFLVIIFEPAENAPDDSETVFSTSEPVNLRLEAALLQSQSQYRSSIEHSEIQAEELKASNEELQAINEELRSTTEELETGKEELQSVNEELVTVNQELKIKIEELSNSNNDLQNLINSASVGTIFLDRSLRVKMFTPAACEIFNFIPADIGRLLSDITHKLEDENLIADIETVLKSLQPFEREVRNGDGNFYLMQIKPYRTAEDHINGTIITFVNITETKRQELELRESEAKYRSLFTSIDEGFYLAEVIWDEAGKPVDIFYSDENPAAVRMIGQTTKNRLMSDINPNYEQYWRDIFGRTARTGEAQRLENYAAPNDMWFDFYVFKPEGVTDDRTVSVVFQDITERKRRENNLAFLAGFSQNLILLTTEQEIVENFGEKFSQLTGISVCAFFEINEQAGEAAVTAEWHKADDFSLNGKFNIPELVSDEFSQAMNSGKTIVVRDIFNDSHAKGKKQLAAFGIGSFVNVPIVSGSEWKFVLGVYHDAPYNWRDDEIALLTEAAERIWTKIERARAEQALRESENRFRLAGEAVEAIIYDWNITDDTIVRSPELEKLLGFSPDDAETQTNAWWKLRVHPEDAERAINLVKNKINSDAPRFEDEYRIQHRDGHFVWVSDIGIFQRENGKAFRCVGSVTSITHRKRAEEALRESEERFRAMFEQANVGIVQTTIDGRLVDPNPGFCKIIGYTQTEARKLSLRDITHPDDYGREVELTRQLLTDEIAGYSIEKRYVRKDGGILWGNMTTTLLRDRDGKPYHALAIVEDISERKAAEAKFGESQKHLKLIMECVTDYAIITNDTEGIVTGWNPGAEKIFGYAAGEMLGRKSDLIFTPEDRKKGVPVKEMRTAAKKGRAEDERLHARKDGSHFYVSGIMQPLKDGKLDGFVKIARDMTERIKAEQIARDKEMLQKLVGAQEDERKRIARDLHDELGQLLTALRLKLEVVRKLCEENELCGKIDETQLLAKKIDEGIDFLAWELRPAALDDFGLYPALVKYVREWSHYSGVPAELLDSDLKKARFSHEVETNLYRIAQESLNNVYKHANAGRAEIAFDKRGDLIVLIVEDDGAGFNVEDKKNRKKGIGLIGMEERAALIGGTLEIESAPGEGTTIFARVPAIGIERENRDDE